MIPTHNRSEMLREALTSLEYIHFPKDRFEVIVIDDGSTDQTKVTVEDVQKKSSYRLKYLYQNKKGISAAKNLGIQYAEGEWIVSTDDDCEFERDWLHQLTADLKEPNVGAVGGPDRALASDSFFSRCVDYTMTCFLGTGGIRGGTKIRVGKYFPRGCNMAFKKEVVDNVGGFIEGFAPGEEIELDLRIQKAGYLLRYAPNAWVWHKRRGSLRSFLRQIFSRGYSRVKLADISSEFIEPVHVVPAVLIILFLIFLPLSFFNQTILRIFMILTVSYMVMLMTSGILSTVRTKNLKSILVVPFLLFLQQTAYGLGFLVSFFEGFFRKAS